jgi:hypothetical protein
VLYTCLGMIVIGTQRYHRGTLRRLTASNNDQHQQQTKPFYISAHRHCFPGAGTNHYFTERLGLF